jgi:hypothetical protein
MVTDTADEMVAAGALAGWRRQSTEHGCVLELQLASNVADFAERNLSRVAIALNERQLRSLARDLSRAAEERGIELWPERRRWRLW